MLQNKVLSK